jgi:GntR family transcriptional repressor for pyruvate dehydrogenase complex
MEDIQVHERVVNILIKQIFNRQFKPGDKLPSERQLAKEMGVDRVSLRIGLKHLEMMNVLFIRQGDGIYVRDYLKGASIDFLRILFLQLEQTDEELLIDPYIIDELWEFWVAFFPEILKMAAKRYTPRDLKPAMEILNEQLANLHDKTRLVELELKSQELVADIAHNIVVILLSNTCRPLRKKMTEIVLSSMKDDDIKNHINIMKQMMRTFMTSSTEDRYTLIEQYRNVLKSYHLILRKSLFKDSDNTEKKQI